MVSALDSGANGLGSSPGRRLLLCSWARHFTLTVPHSTQVYKWVPADCWGNLTNCGGVTCDGLASHPGEVEILLAASWDNRDNFQLLYGITGITCSSYEQALAPRLHFTLADVPPRAALRYSP